MHIEDLIGMIQSISSVNCEIEPETPLIGENSLLDSFSLVQLLIAIEEQAEEEGFEFDWTSEKAMSLQRSIYKTPSTLLNEYNSQMRAKAEG